MGTIMPFSLSLMYRQIGHRCSVTRSYLSAKTNTERRKRKLTCLGKPFVNYVCNYSLDCSPTLMSILCLSLDCMLKCTIPSIFPARGLHIEYSRLHSISFKVCSEPFRKTGAIFQKELCQPACCNQDKISPFLSEKDPFKSPIHELFRAGSLQ